VVAGILGELRPGGWLALAPAESSAELCRGFVPAEGAGGTLWRRPEAGASAPAPPPFFRTPAPGTIPARAPVTAAAVARAPASARIPSPAPGRSGALLANAAEERWRRLVDQGEWPAALAVCAERLAATPGDAGWHLREALVHDAAGDAAAAERALRRTLYLDRANALAHYQLGLLCARAGRDADAARCWRNAVSVLASADDRAPVAGGDGMTTGDLRRLVALATQGASAAGAPAAGGSVAGAAAAGGLPDEAGR
jgi:chemotaxis protein methyltransferase CheR